MGAPLFPPQKNSCFEQYWIWGPVILTKTANFRTIHKLTSTLYLSSQCRQPTIQHFFYGEKMRKVPRSLGKTEGPQQNHRIFSKFTWPCHWVRLFQIVWFGYSWQLTLTSWPSYWSVDIAAGLSSRNISLSDLLQQLQLEPAVKDATKAQQISTQKTPHEIIGTLQIHQQKWRLCLKSW